MPDFSLPGFLLPANRKVSGCVRSYPFSINFFKREKLYFLLSMKDNKNENNIHHRTSNIPVQLSNFLQSQQEKNKKQADAKDEKPDTKFCRLCFESGAEKRQCCNAFYCDHCYVKNQKCPNCGVQTKQEKLTGATYQLKIFSEHEECRVCLDPGTLRRCCGNYYCDDCYYKLPTCRSCGTIVSSIREEKLKKNQFLWFDRATLYSICLGWCLTAFLVFCVVTFLAIVATAEATAPVTINSFTCYGFFRTCTVQVCIDLNESVAMGTNALPSLSTFTPCTLNSQVKLESPACVYDQNLYHQSNQKLGYDVCTDLYSQGVYIFEDNFENWQNISISSNLMKSATWNFVKNGFANTFCGANEGSDLKSLSFRGEEKRFAETRDLDVQSGGIIDFRMFMPPLTYDFTVPLCRSGFIGKVNLEYSTNQGKNYTIINIYDPAIWRQDRFFHQKVEIPSEARTNSTRFRWHQPEFEFVRDNWAIDDVKILRYLPNDWQRSDGFISNKQKSDEEIQFAQCCADTDWCHQRLTPDQRAQCGKQFDWYTDRTYLFRLSEIIICVALLLNLIKFIYCSCNNYLLFHHYPFHEEFLMLINLSCFSRILEKLPLDYRIYFTLLLNQWNNEDKSASNNIANGNLRINETIQQIHQSARYQEDLRQELKDLEGQGLMLKSPEEIEEEKKEYYKKIKKQKKKLAKRMEKKNFRGSTIAIEENQEYLDTLDANVLRPRDDNNNLIPENQKALSEMKEGEYQYDANSMMMIDDQIPDNVERMKRQNMAMLRVPFEFETDDSFRFYFFVGVMILFSAMFLIELALSTSFSIYQPVEVFGMFQTTFYINGSLLTIFAGVNDLKEIYYVIKNVIPCTRAFFPLITVDLTEDGRSLYMGHHRIPLAQISEITAFPKSFSYYNLLGVVCGVFPYNLFSLLIREAFLKYETMRFVTPFIGSICIIRAVLGPLFLIKAVYVLEYVFSYHFNIREAIGKAMQKKSTLHMTVNVSLGLTILGMVFCALTSVENVPYVVVAGMFGGACYGLFTGTAHELPIKPWICKFSFFLRKVSLI
jgi:hypothetical protein